MAWHGMVRMTPEKIEIRKIMYNFCEWRFVLVVSLFADWNLTRISLHRSHGHRSIFVC